MIPLTALFLESMWFWGFFGAAFFIILMVCEAKENGVASFLWFLAFLAGAQAYSVYVQKVSLIPYVTSDLSTILIGLGIYLVVGVLWSVIKWVLYVRERAGVYLKLKTEWQQDQLKKGVPADQLDDAWLKMVEKNEFAEFDDYPPQVSNHKADLTRWMACWFTSLIWTFLSDFITGFFHHLLSLFSGAFQRLSNWIFSKYTK